MGKIMIRTTVQVFLRADNGEQDEFITPINLTPDKARNYYVGRIFNMGTVEDKMMMCYAVHILQVQERRKAVVKVQTSFGRNCLNEIRGLKEGEVWRAGTTNRIRRSISPTRATMRCFGWVRTAN